MSRHRRAYQTATAAAVVTGWAVFYLVYAATRQPPADPATATPLTPELLVVLAIPVATYVLAALLVLHHWLAGPGARLSTMDPPGRLLTAAVATLPGGRREWGAAMAAELAGIPDRATRWRFALSCARAAVLLPPAGGWPVLALVAGGVVAAVTATGQAAGAAVPGVGVLATSLVGSAGVLAVLGVARSRRPRAPAPAAALLVAGGVAAAVTAVVVFLVRQPAAAAHLPAGSALLLGAALAGCLWVAVASPAADRLAPRLGVAGAALFTVVLLAVTHLVAGPGLASETRQRLDLATIWWLFVGSTSVFFFAALAASLRTGSFRSGMRAGLWTLAACTPLTFAVWLAEAPRRHELTGGLLFAGDAGPIGVNLSDAVWILWFVAVAGLPCAVFGAAVGAYHRAPRAG
ncbi:hypothetical protein [Phytohabitans suffuscus]|uniref:Uncharacterized protein n=1 Tax=Phytohabitans suffuscus TaxID=624315 RepID=A0A6F8YWP9_9ACTN|nr:hypothetical protein [Phytohabitans suffuscus]BCB90522.1 hypothetical protein Psuf_078350 [Phytohabitans suffuscus]